MAMQNKSDATDVFLKIADKAATRRQGEYSEGDDSGAVQSASVFPPAPHILSAQFPAVPASVPVPQAGYLQRCWIAGTAPGFTLKQRFRSLPLLGYGFAWLNALLRLPIMRHSTAVELHTLREQNHLLRQQVGALNERIDQLHPYMAEESAKVAGRLRRYDLLDIGNRLMKIEQLESGRQLKAIKHLLQVLQTDGVALSDRQSDILQRLLRLEQGGDTLAPSMAATTAHDFDRDRFYLEFEHLFRGSRADIKQRQQVYLPYLSHITSRKEGDRPAVLDVGCGRGEWLELMGEQGIPALGIDLNAAMVDACIERGYAAKVADAIAYLRQRKAASLGAVTGFHIIEHLPFEQMIALFDAALHALCEGGVLIFETPNPENLIVGACNFYYDPTHLHPVVPDVARFIASQRGFADVEILRLHPFPADYQMPSDSPADKALNKFLFSAQDYAVIARK